MCRIQIEILLMLPMLNFDDITYVSKIKNLRVRFVNACHTQDLKRTSTLSVCRKRNYDEYSKKKKQTSRFSSII